MREPLGKHISIKHGYAFDGDYFVEEDNGVVLLTPGNFAIGGGFQEGKKYYNGSYPSEYVLSPGDLVVTMTDLSKTIDTLGYAALVPNDGRVYLHNQRIGLIEFKDDELDRIYLSYLLRTYHYQRTIAGSSTGSTVHHTSPAKIEAYPIELPPLPVQKRIANILSAYDKLIENSRRQIALLEEAAKRLYKEWFVDLCFPGHETTPIIDGLPEGWHREPLSELGNYLNGFAFKPSDHYAHGLPIVKIKELQEGIACTTPRNPGSEIPEIYRIEKGDLIFSWSATLLAKVWPEEPALLNQHLFKVSPRRDIPKEFLLQLINASIPALKGYTTGSTMTHLQRNKLERFKAVIPAPLLLAQFERMTTPMRMRSMDLERTTCLLREARDRLLLKLMSGEIEVV